MKTGLTAALIAAFVLAALPAAASATTNDDPAQPAAACVECCEGVFLCQTLASLTDMRRLVEAAVPERGVANSLEVKLDAVTRSVTAARYRPALGQLDAFDHELTTAESTANFELLSKLIQMSHDMKKGIIANLRA